MGCAAARLSWTEPSTPTARGKLRALGVRALAAVGGTDMTWRVAAQLGGSRSLRRSLASACRCRKPEQA
eukprot:2591795-Rhodomonas_salina.2